MNKKLVMIVLSIITFNSNCASVVSEISTNVPSCVAEEAQAIVEGANAIVFDACRRVIIAKKEMVFDQIWSAEREEYRAQFLSAWSQFSNCSLLAVALQTRQPSIVKKLLDAGAGVETIDYEKNSAFDYVSSRLKDTSSVKEEKKELLKLLLEYCNLETKNKHTWLQAAKGDVNFFEVLHENGFDFNTMIDEKGTDLLIQAAAQGQIELVKYLSSNGIAVDVNHLHAAMDTIKNFDRLHAAEKEREGLNDTILTETIRKRMCDIITYLCTQGLRPSPEDFIGQADDVVKLLGQIVKNKNKNLKKKAKKKAKKKEEENVADTRHSAAVASEEKSNEEEVKEEVQREEMTTVNDVDNSDQDSGDDITDIDRVELLLRQCILLHDLREEEAAKHQLEQLESVLDLSRQMTFPYENYYSTPSDIHALLRSLIKEQHKKSIRALTTVRNFVSGLKSLFIPAGEYSGYELLKMAEDAREA